MVLRRPTSRRPASFLISGSSGAVPRRSRSCGLAWVVEVAVLVTEVVVVVVEVVADTSLVRYSKYRKWYQTNLHLGVRIAVHLVAFGIADCVGWCVVLQREER